MKYIVASDIFGITPALKELSSELNQLKHLDIISPYGEETIAFKDEQHAYQHFIEHVGLDNYTQYLVDRVERESVPVSLLGFSVGASAIWRSSEYFTNEKVAGALCFYGGQIRRYQEIAPKFPISLIFPEQEPHFNVNELITNLKQSGKVTCNQLPYLHGFMNRHSVNFNLQAYQQVMAKLMLLVQGGSFDLSY